MSVGTSISNTLQQELIVGIKEGSHSAFNELLNIYGRKLLHFSLSYRISKEDAEEIVQEVFVRIWKNRESLDETQHVDGYIITIAKHLILNALRKKTSTDHFLAYAKGRTYHTNNTEDEVIFSDLESLIQQAFMKLPRKRQLVYRMSRYEGLSNHEIARKLSLSKSTVENHLNHALSYFRKVILQAGIHV